MDYYDYYYYLIFLDGNPVLFKGVLKDAVTA